MDHNISSQNIQQNSRKITFNGSVIKVEGLETKFDVIPVSNSLALLVGDRDEATIVQQLYYWISKGYGEVIDNVRWIYKPIKEWIQEVFPTFSKWKVEKLLRQLTDREIIIRKKLFTKHQIQSGDRFWWQPKNQTYYYSLNTERLQELADNYVVPETLENSVCLKTRKLSKNDIKHTKDSDYSENITKSTSIENFQTQDSPSYSPKVKLESESYGKKTNTLDRNLENEDPWIDTSKQIEQVATDKFLKKENKPRRVVHHKERIKQSFEQGPWDTPEEFQRFYRALVTALPIIANARNADAVAKTIVRDICNGIPHSYWLDWKNGLAIGTADKPEWEIEPGVPYPMFVEYLTEKLRAGNNTTTEEQTKKEVFSILDKPKVAKAFWGQFKRSLLNVSGQVERDRNLGVTNPNTPIWTRERVEPSVEEAAEAGKKIMAINSDTSELTSQVLLEAKRGLPQMPKALGDSNSSPKEDELDTRRVLRRQEISRKTHISQMSVAEINELISDPIFRAQLTPQLYKSNYELITDELGQIIGVESSKRGEDV